MLDWYFDLNPFAKLAVALVLLGLGVGVILFSALGGGVGRRTLVIGAVLAGLGFGAFLLAIPPAGDRKQKEWGDW